MIITDIIATEYTEEKTRYWKYFRVFLCIPWLLRLKGALLTSRS